jgi:signal transduction histidine kinase
MMEKTVFIHLDSSFVVIDYHSDVKDKIKPFHKIKNNIFFPQLHKTLWKMMERDVHRALVEGKTSFQEKKLRTEFKKNDYFLITIAPIADNKRIDGVEIVFKNIQAQKDREEEKDLRQKMATISSLASKLAHQLNNPLAAILNQIGALLLEDLNSVEPLRLREEIQTLQEQVYSLSVLTNSFEAFTQEQPHTYRLVNIGNIIEKSVELVKLLETSGKIDYALRIDKNLPYILGNEITLELSLINVLRNSIEALPDGGKIAVNACIDPPGENVVIEIKDTGAGFQIDNLYRPFDPFFTTKSEGHVGLGLTVTYNVISNHNGRIKLDKGKHTTVTLTLPIPKK